jgi:hypothetical protein
MGIGSGFFGIVNATISVFKDTPKIAIETVKAVGRMGTIGVHHPEPAAASADPTVNANGQNMVPSQHSASLGIDPALLAAEQIETQLLNLNELLNDDLPTIVEEGGSEILACTQRLEALKKGLGDFQSKHAMNARAILDEALEVTAAIIAHDNTKKSKKGNFGEWEKKISQWGKTMKSLLNRATKLRSFAASQPGQGFGGSLDVSDLNVSPDDSAYSKVLHQRHQKLLITRSAMNDARNNIERTAEMQLQAQAQIVEIARMMGEPKHKQATLEDTKKILSKSIDVMAAMQDEVRQLTGFFNALASIISIVCKGHAEQYLQTIDAGITRQGGQFAIAYNEQQLQIIRETVITLRGHFSFVVHSADMYQEIATTHINPCIRMAANLPLSAGPAEQEEAKKVLQQTTDKSSEAIKKLAQQELEAYHNDLEKRVLEIEGELVALGLPAPEADEENLKAIEDGVKESSEEIAEELEEMGGLFEEITDDL